MSPAALEANRRLMELRARLGREVADHGTTEHGAGCLSCVSRAPDATAMNRLTTSEGVDGDSHSLASGSDYLPALWLAQPTAPAYPDAPAPSPNPSRGEGDRTPSPFGRGVGRGSSALAPPLSIRPNWPLYNAIALLNRRREEAGIGRARTSAGTFPWLDERLAPAGGDESIRSPSPREGAGEGAVAPDAQDKHPAPQSGVGTVTVVHPTLLLTILRQELEGPARVWLLLRAIDGDGRGWLAGDEARRQLTVPDSPWRCCGRRRLRQLLAQGEGLFWTRDGRDRLWLAGPHRVAGALDCGRMRGAPVELPVAALRGGIQAVRAAFYASFHSGRREDPISRATLAALSGVPGRTQLTYDRVAGVARQPNLVIAEPYSAERFQERAWQRGRAVFRFVDAAGRHGPRGRAYIAWGLPNSYHGPYARRGAGGRRRLNRKLDDLMHEGTLGNGERTVERVFWPDGAAAAKGFNRGPERDAYWRRKRAQDKNPVLRTGVWYVIGAAKSCWDSRDKYK